MNSSQAAPGMRFRTLTLSLLIPGALFALACGNDGRSYPQGLGDDEYDLASMALTEADVPAGMVEALAQEFDNEVTAQTFQEDDPEAKVRELEAKGRLKGHITIFSYEDPIQHLAKIGNIYSQSTLFTDADSARQSLREICDLQQYAEAPQLEDILVPALGEGSVGFVVTTPADQLGVTVDTVVCFRTGRVVHSIIASGLDGSQDLAETYRLARQMLERVDLAYDAIGDAPADPADDEDEETGG
ncbi:MAG TPA: hypothetical protein VFK32_06395 [Tepidiformaceae bacterium]|nr:hypothetical protein [Tepidiformaceae bacterium]